MSIFKKIHMTNSQTIPPKNICKTAHQSRHSRILPLISLRHSIITSHRHSKKYSFLSSFQKMQPSPIRHSRILRHSTPSFQKMRQHLSGIPLGIHNKKTQATKPTFFYVIPTAQHLSTFFYVIPEA